MNDSVSAADGANHKRFERMGVAADAGTVARIREQFACWLGRFFDLDPVRGGDIVLATNEALANAAEFAYLLADRPGTMDLRASYDAARARLTVTISDSGSWHISAAIVDTGSRCRGIPLMRALSDDATIEMSTAGTQVSMQWNGVRHAVADRLRGGQNQTA
ncbi:MAG TPA: ATP-binding protein [Mycobacterium sp.]|nr:ATP-binding protein [Mycobacterium sp.]